MAALTAIVLGATNPHIQLIKKLKKRGYYVILVDYLPISPAKEYADEHIQESTLDEEKVLSIARERKASLVITTNIDQANVTACYVAEQLGLPCPYSYLTALNVTDKERMKAIMVKNGIPTSRHIIVENADLKNFDLTFPVVVKPCDSNGSRGVNKASDEEELRRHISTAVEVSRNKRAVVEEFIEGKEISFYYYISDYKPYYITSNQRFRFRVGTTGVIQSAGGLYPAQVSEAVIQKMHDLTGKIALAFDLGNTPIFIQAMVRDEEVYVLEFAPRIGGGLSYRLIEENNDFDIINAAIDSFLQTDTPMTMKPDEMLTASMNLYAPGITVGKITGVEEVLSKGLAFDFFTFKPKGSVSGSDMSSASRVGGFLVRGRTYREVIEKIYEINDTVEVLDINGDRKMMHDIYDIEEDRL